MKNRLSFVAVVAAVAAGAVLSATVQTANASDEGAAAAKTPGVTANVAKQLKAANDALMAGKADEAIAHVKEAQAAKGEKTPYDEYVANALLGAAYYSKSSTDVNAATALEAAAASEYAKPEQQKAWFKAVMGIYYNNKDYDKTVEAGQKVIAKGAADDQIYGMMGDSYFHLSKFKEAADFIQQVTDKEDKPQEKYLKFEYQNFTKVNDPKGADKALDKLLTYYPSSDYWLIALGPMLRTNMTDAHMQLALYRFEFDLGLLKRPSDFADMAELALDEGYPGETVLVLTKAFQQNAFTEQRDKDRYQHLLDGAKQRAAKDQAGLAAAEPAAQKAADGNQLIQLGAAYLSYGQTEKAIALLQQGIAKGMLKYPEEATLLLGEAQLRAGNASQARATFEKVGNSENANYSRLGKLWTLHASTRSAA